MASLIPGYEYDIFISYRQKDNKYDGWVTEFVDNLRKELEATFKEEISVYFDINPHDGLLETHDVDASLKDKLKCLLFIPIISRTYCDPKSFAWEHEFKAFVEQASKDPFGLKVKLPNGNVASRILPIRIYDLDAADIKLCEMVLGGVLRGVEFIYTEPGVNRPLRQRDDDVTHTTKQIIYRDQINKVGNAIKEIISGLKTATVEPNKEKIQHDEPLVETKKEERKEVQEKPAKLTKWKLMSGVTILAILIITAVFAYPTIFKRDNLEKLRSSGERISVVVMPFQNMTNDTVWNIWQSGIQDILITYLSNSLEELKVPQAETVNFLIQGEKLTNYASITPLVASKISQKLDADILIYGSIKQSGTRLRLNTQLIDSRTRETLRAFEIEGPAKEEFIFHITDSLKLIVKNFLVISKLSTEIPVGLRLTGSTSDSPEALRYYMYGHKAFTSRDYPTARNWYLKAFAIDSNFITASVYIALSYGNQGIYEEGKKWCKRVYEKIESLPLNQKLIIKWLYAAFFETPYEEIKYLKQLLVLDDQKSLPYYILGITYNELQQYDKAIPEFEKALELHEKWGLIPIWGFFYNGLGIAYHNTGQYKKEKKLYKEAEQNFPDDIMVIRRHAILLLTEGDEKAANKYIERYIALRKENSASEASVALNLGDIYWFAGLLDKAEEYYRKALMIEPENPDMLNALAWCLINKDREINKVRCS